MISPLSRAANIVGNLQHWQRAVIFLIAAASVWPILINTASGVHAIDPGYLQVARSFGTCRIELLTVVLLPLSAATCKLACGWH